MIAFDNTPRDGDYVRYIDDLMRRTAIATRASQEGVVQDTGPATRGTGFAVPTEANKASATAEAIASALMSGEIARRVVLTAHQKVGIGAIALGIVVGLSALLWQPFNLAVLITGIAIAAWAVRMMRDARSRLNSTRT